MAICDNKLPLKGKSKPTKSKLLKAFEKQRFIVVSGEFTTKRIGASGSPEKESETMLWEILPYALEKDGLILRAKATVFSFNGSVADRPHAFTWKEGEKNDTVILEIRGRSAQLIYREEFNL